ncbi:MAG: response regulator [Phycisphaerales bacterium]
MPGEAQSSESHERIVLADDNADMREYVRGLLAQRYRVETVGNGRAAIDTARRERPDLIITDVMMPVLDGFGLLAEVRRDPVLQSVPVLMLSARAGEEARLEGLRAGADDYLVKPFSGRELVGRVGSLLHIAQVRREGELRERELRGEAEALNEVAIAIAGDLDLDKIVQKVTDAATELTHAAFGAFFYNVINEKGESYTLYSLSGVPRSAFEKFPMPRNTAVFGPTFNGEGVVRSDDITKDPRYGKNAPHHGMPKGHLPVRSYLAAPVISRSGEVLGGLFFGHPETGVFTERAERLAAGVAAQAAVAIDNARLYGQAKRERQALAQSEERLRQTLESERAARAEAERAGRMKDEFLATLSHELRTPLNAILGWTHLLRKQGANAGTVEQGLSVIDRNARLQTQLIADLLDMSRIISGKMRLDVQRVELPLVIEAALESVRPAAEAKDVRIQSVLEPIKEPIHGDPARLQQIVWNLLSNAVKFTPRGGRVQVVLARVNSHVEVTISDTGKGIKPDFLPHVFDRFRQADSSAAREHGGLGLGLAIVKQLVELHGGSVHAASEGDGKGATFSIHLPLAVLHQAAHQTEKVHPRAAPLSPVDGDEPDLAGVRVLVVDDEPDARDIVRRVLEEAGATVWAAGSAREGVEQAAAHAPDVIISDIGMPGEDGYSFIRSLRNAGHQIPAAALTAFARSEDRTRALLAGYQTHLSKPVEPSELLAAIASLTNKPGVVRPPRRPI